jgi:hypothetical protein
MTLGRLTAESGGDANGESEFTSYTTNGNDSDGSLE